MCIKNAGGYAHTARQLHLHGNIGNIEQKYIISLSGNYESIQLYQSLETNNAILFV